MTVWLCVCLFAHTCVGVKIPVIKWLNVLVYVCQIWLWFPCSILISTVIRFITPIRWSLNKDHYRNHTHVSPRKPPRWKSETRMMTPVRWQMGHVVTSVSATLWFNEGPKTAWSQVLQALQSCKNLLGYFLWAYQESVAKDRLSRTRPQNLSARPKNLRTL